MKDRNSVDLRTYLITVHLKNVVDGERVVQQMYKIIKDHLNLGRSEGIPFHRLPSIIWSVDAAGSRFGGIQSLHSIPHLHAILILSRATDCYRMNIPAASLSEKLTKVRGIVKLPGHKTSVDIRNFELLARQDQPPETWRQFYDFISYAVKGEVILSTSHIEAATELTSGVLPYDNFSPSTRQYVDQEKLKIEKNLGNRDRLFKHFSRPYV